jgi:type I restriction enzyme M protein
VAQQNLFPKELTRGELISLVDRAADLIRTAVDYKFILVLLFLKRLNDLWKIERLQAKQRLVKEASLPEQEAEEEAEKETFHTFNIPKQYLWDEVTRDVKNLPEKLATGISEIAKLNKELQGVINRVDFLEFARNQENRELLRQLVELFNKYNLGGKEVSPDILGDAYEHILMKFAPEKAKEGEIYTPREVIKLMVEILDPKPGESVYDPCCGSGGMLITSHLHVAEKFSKEETSKLFLNGQERNPEIYAVCEMNLILHDIKNANIANGDTLDYPRFRDDSRLKQFDVVIANIPWNQDGYGEERLKKADFRERFSLGYSPQNSADWSWVQHMLASAKEDGRVGLVVDNACLFRGGSEGIIRSKIIEHDLVDCVVLLPKKLFYNTGAPGAILIFNKNKAKKRKDKILFINASKEFILHPSIRRLNSLSKENIKKIADAYEDFAEIAGFSRSVEKKEVIDNDYNLNMSLYVMPIEQGEEINILKEFSELKRLEVARQEVESKLERSNKRFMRGLLTKGIGHKEFKDTEIGGILPKEWQVVRLGDILSLEYGAGLPEKERVAGRYPVCGSNGIIGYHNESLVKGPGIIVGRKGTMGAVSWVDSDFWPIDTTYFVRVKKDAISLKWLFFKLAQIDLKRLTLSDVVPGLKRSLVYSIKIHLPPLSEQKRIADILSMADETLELERNEKARLERIKHGLMDLLLTEKIGAKV